MGDPEYQGESKAVHVEFDSLGASPVTDGPITDSPSYLGRSPLFRVLPEAPSWDLDEHVTGPLYEGPHYRGRSQAIHVRGPKVTRPTPAPIPSCRCCAGAGDCVFRFDRFDDFDRVIGIGWASASSGPAYTSVGTGFAQVNTLGTMQNDSGSTPTGLSETFDGGFTADDFSVVIRVRATTDDVIGVSAIINTMGFGWHHDLGSPRPVPYLYIDDNFGVRVTVAFPDITFWTRIWAEDDGWAIMKAERVGGVGRLKLWEDGTTEPDWDVSATLSTGHYSTDAINFSALGVDVVGFQAVELDYIDFGASSCGDGACGITDMFDRTVAAPSDPGPVWGDSDAGLPWRGGGIGGVGAFNGATAFVDGTRGVLKNATSTIGTGSSTRYAGCQANLNDALTVVPSSGVVQVTFDIDPESAGSQVRIDLANSFIFMNGNSATPASFFQAAFFGDSGTQVDFVSWSYGTSTWNVKWLETTTSLSAKIWLVSDPEPGSWTVSTSPDSTSTPFDPNFKLSLLDGNTTSGGHATAPQTVFWDNLAIDGVPLCVSVSSAVGDCSDCSGLHTQQVVAVQRYYLGALSGWGYTVYQRVPGPSDTGTTLGGTIEEGWDIGTSPDFPLSYPSFAQTPIVLVSSYENSQFFNFGSPRSNGLDTSDLYYRVPLPASTTRVAFHTDLVTHVGSTELSNLADAGIASWPPVNMRAGHVTAQPTSIHDPAGTTVATVTPRRRVGTPGPTDYAAGPSIDVDLPFTPGDDSVSFWFEFLTEPFQGVLGLIDDAAVWVLEVALSLEGDSGFVHNYAYVEVHSVENALVDCSGSIVSPVIEVPWTYGTHTDTYSGTPPSGTIAGLSSTNPDWTAAFDSNLPRDGLNEVTDGGRITVYAEADLSDFTGAALVNGKLDLYYEFVQQEDRFQGHTLDEAHGIDANYDVTAMYEAGAMWAFSTPSPPDDAFRYAGVLWYFDDAIWRDFGFWTVQTESSNGSLDVAGSSNFPMSGPILPGVRYSVRIKIDKFGSNVFSWRAWRTDTEPEPTIFASQSGSSVFLANDTFKKLWSWAAAYDGGAFESDGFSTHYIDAFYTVTLGRRRVENIAVNGIATGSNGGALTGDCTDCAGALPFTPGFMPTFRRQIGDPTTSLDSFICTMESAAMVLDWHTRGAISVWGGELIPWCGKTVAQIEATGTNLGNAEQAWAHYGQVLSVRSGQTFDQMLACLTEGRAVILQGDYSTFSNAVKCQDSFEGFHAISVYPYQVGDVILVGDPLCSTFHGVSVSALRAYAEAFGRVALGSSSPQGILFAVSRPWSPAP